MEAARVCDQFLNLYFLTKPSGAEGLAEPQLLLRQESVHRRPDFRLNFREPYASVLLSDCGWSMSALESRQTFWCWVARLANPTSDPHNELSCCHLVPVLLIDLSGRYPTISTP